VDDRYLKAGLNALSRAASMEYFTDGHRGGAIVSAVYLCREVDVESEVSGLLGERIDKMWAGTELCGAFPVEKPQPELVDRIHETMAQHAQGLRQVGHNVILPTLALRAFHDVPETITESRVDGVCRLISQFTVYDLPIPETPVALPHPADKRAYSEFVLSEFVACCERFIGRGQGWAGHLLTYARALMDLVDLEQQDLANRMLDGLTTYFQRIRMGPQDTDVPRDKHKVAEWTPLQSSYWANKTGDWRLGHVLKYPYGFYGLMKHAEDVTLKRECESVAYRIF
jgi:hypothetical protein